MWLTILLLGFLLPLSSHTALAQTNMLPQYGLQAPIETEPLLPAPTPPSGPVAPAAPGQPTFPGQTVLDRPRPEYDPIGIRYGSFFIFPRGEVDPMFNSNIFATPKSTSDYITLVQPGFDILSNFSRHSINLHAGSASLFYAAHPDQNTQNGWATVDGTFDIDATHNFYAAAQVAHLSVPRTSVNSPGNAAVPITYNLYGAAAGFAQTKLRFTYSADVAVQNYQYNSVQAIGGGTLPQSAQDVTISQVALKAGYEFIPDYRGFVRVSGNLRDYMHTIPGGTSPNSTGYRVDVGLDVLPRHLIYGTVYAGYLNQTFANSAFGSISAPDFGGRVVWNFTPLTTIRFDALRAIAQSNPTIGAVTGNGYTATVVTANVDHEVRHNVLINFNTGYENDKFQGISRTDNVFNVGFGFKYMLNRNLFLGANYNFQKRTSNADNTAYSQHVLLFRIGTQF